MSTNPTPQLPPYEEFVGFLRSALHYLYDPVHLRRSLLVEYLGQAGSTDRAGALQRILMESIQALKPSENEPPQSSAWIFYDILNLQYIRQYARSVVASQLGVSERQLRREQRLALEALAQYLWKRYPMPEALAAPRPSPEQQKQAQVVKEPAGSPETYDGFASELGWLKDPAYQQLSPLEEVLATVDQIARPLAQQWQTVLQIETGPGVRDFPVAELVTRNILLTILSVIVPRSRQRLVHITAAQQGNVVEIRTASPSGADSPSGAGSPAEPFTEKEKASLNTARQFADISGTQMSIIQPGDALVVILSLPAPEQIPVLVVDDNTDWLDLLKRYAVGSRYQVIGTREPEQARGLAEKFQPALIFLDVMMPAVDGWQIISELRSERITRDIPIVVCSILPLGDLALSLGVNAFLQKPITQSQFIEAIEQQLGERE